ncbi:hypothetical protein ACH34F_05210 [Elizabethkingia anophelis]|uniref:hypothetical protein n=1 Tax=Elizabethkingia anophelis TaxID=1117645 RepID=UPI000531686F|nr:hypothetical protein NV63_06950 [Elizabethkingia anophelis]
MSNFTNERFTATIFVDGNPFIDPTISILQDIYHLDKYDFDKIINGKSNLSESQNLLIGTSVALFINMVAKFMGNKIDPKITFDNWEVYAFILSIVLLGIISVLNHFIPSQRKKIIKKIKTHFKI